MKKKLLSIILLVTALILVGCGAEESEGEVASIYMTDGPKYQYQMINTDEIMVQYEDGRPDKKLSDYSGSYTTDTAVYLGSEVGVYLDGEHYSTVVEYVPYTNIDFKRNVGDIDLYILMCREMEAKTDWFEGTITYADGYVGSIDAKEVELKRNADKLVVKITVWGNDALGYEILIPEAWDDMNLNEQSQEEIDEWYDGLGSGDSEVTEESMSSSVVKDVDTSNWTVEVQDYSTSSSYVKFVKMKELLGLFKQGITKTNNPELDGTCKAFTYEFKDDSDWVRMFGTSTINDVYMAYGLPEYGVYRACSCGLHENDKNVQELLDSLGVKEESERLSFTGTISTIPLDRHIIYNMSKEELVDYMANAHVYSLWGNKGNGLGWNETQRLYQDEFLFTLYGTSVEEIEDKFSVYFSYESDIREIYSVYLNSDYPGNMFEFYLEDTSVLDGYMAKYMNDGLQNVSEEQKSEVVITNYQADILTRHGYEIPSFATRVN